MRVCSFFKPVAASMERRPGLSPPRLTRGGPATPFHRVAAGTERQRRRIGVAATGYLRAAPARPTFRRILSAPSFSQREDDPLMSRPVGIALIGMGRWGKKMLNVLGAAPADIQVVRAVEPNLETARAICAEKGVALSAEYADALADPAVEAVVLATPHALHGAQIEAAVAAGKLCFGVQN